MAKRLSMLTMRKENGASRLMRAEVHAVLCKLVAKREPELRVRTGVFGSNGWGEFCVDKPIGAYFTTEEFNLLADYLRGAADALELDAAERTAREIADARFAADDARRLAIQIRDEKFGA